MDPNKLVKLIEILNRKNKPGRIIITPRMGAKNMRVKLPHLIKAVQRARQIVSWVTDPMHENTIKAPSGFKTRIFDAIRMSCLTSSMITSLIVFKLCKIFTPPDSPYKKETRCHVDREKDTFKTNVPYQCRSSVGQPSRVNNKKGMKVLCREKNGHYRNYITNLVCKEFSIYVRY
ncbi:phospho-2-dehydro-3-deoxyheptonate aldolase 1, chloroplastic-like protein [Tanacetum coccineum]